MNMRDDKLSEQFRCAQGNTGQLLHRWANSERCQSNSRAVVDINAHLNDWSQQPTRDSAVLVRFRCGFSAIRERLASYFIGIKCRISSSRKRKRKRRVMAIVELISNRIFTRVVFFSLCFLHYSSCIFLLSSRRPSCSSADSRRPNYVAVVILLLLLLFIGNVSELEETWAIGRGVTSPLERPFRMQQRFVQTRITVTTMPWS